MQVSKLQRVRGAIGYSRQDADYVVLGQHQDDQAETLLLQFFAERE